ncbi:hypothetical protein J7E25_09395 [Agromyces sp. ISL-38]|uniref:hypothetical protein n=1 Tax=Agromyces sp. ISL-38 TaxID=2819107 RepID=UPI001BEB666D|nr:hypothetical protein [Agromyces sp. ISL-38]MBT2499312.1 hypothetical protein [Agromyces sp. ISL-38]MBT2518151.1 hypothetical protein [Streptomyces sp. ISL-90]
MTYPLYPADPNRDPAEPFRNLDPAPTTGSQTTVETPPDAWDDVVDSRPLTTDEVIERQREEFGGVKVGSAFFGWLTATGTAAILTGLLAATGAALGLGVMLDPGASAGVGPFDTETIGWIGAGALLVIVLVAYYCGGYVTGRMARFNGVRQGLAVWVWSLVIAIVVALVSVVLGSQYDVLGELNTFPRIPVSEGVLTIAGSITAVVVAVASLGGAILGAVIGVRYHRRVDRVGFDG